MGGALKRWFEKNTDHILRIYDPPKGFSEPLNGCDAIFISIPVIPGLTGQDTTDLEKAVTIAKHFTKNVFIKSTVLPGTADRLECIAFPEFITERRADEDMNDLPFLIGQCDWNFASKLFPNKNLVFMKNAEAELAKFTHNCFGAMKVAYFNMIYGLCVDLKIDFEEVKRGAFITGFVEKEHTHVPGPDGKFGYGGKCFPENMDALNKFLSKENLPGRHLINTIQWLNHIYRNGSINWKHPDVEAST